MDDVTFLKVLISFQLSAIFSQVLVTPTTESLRLPIVLIVPLIPEYIFLLKVEFAFSYSADLAALS
nr:MAG TPA: hypothetical protein [Caudoviricetes sp.]